MAVERRPLQPLARAPRQVEMSASPPNLDGSILLCHEVPLSLRPSVPTCLSAERIAALFAGDSEDSSDVDEHIEACAECRALVAQVARASAAESAASNGGAPSQSGAGIRGLSRIAAMVGELAQRNAQRRVGSLIGAANGRSSPLLGAGGMAEVYAATHSNGRKAAIKVLRSDLTKDAALCQRFLLEGYAANRVGHPGAIAILDHDVTEDGAPFLVMERLEGVTLKARMARGRLSEEEVVPVAIAILDVLASAHARGIVHRDIKPENVFLTAEQVKVLDFGIARVRDAAGAVETTATGTSMGTPAYMSPEQARGETRRVDARTDVFAVGATMFVALTGRPIHDALGASEVMFFSMTKPVSPLAKVLPQSDPRLARVIDRALSFDRDARWPSAAAMRDALTSYRAHPRARRSRTRVLLLTGASGATALVAALTWTTGRASSLQPAPASDPPSALAPAAPLPAPLQEDVPPPTTVAIEPSAAPRATTPSPSAVPVRVSHVSVQGRPHPETTASATASVEVPVRAATLAPPPASASPPVHPLDHRH